MEQKRVEFRGKVGRLGFVVYCFLLLAFVYVSGMHDIMWIFWILASSFPIFALLSFDKWEKGDKILDSLSIKRERSGRISAVNWCFFTYLLGLNIFLIFRAKGDPDFSSDISLPILFMGLVAFSLALLFLRLNKDAFNVKEKVSYFLVSLLLLVYLRLSSIKLNDFWGFSIIGESRGTEVMYDMITTNCFVCGGVSGDNLVENSIFYEGMVIGAFLIWFGFCISRLKDVRIGKIIFWPIAEWLLVSFLIWNFGPLCLLLVLTVI